MPVCYFGLPMIFVEFLDKLIIAASENIYSYVVLNCGGTTGDAERFFQRAYPVAALFGIVTVDNYVPMYMVADEAEIERRLNHTERAADDISQHINRQGAGRYDAFRGKLPKRFTAAAYTLYKNGRKTKKFTAGKGCTYCGLYARICLRQAIGLGLTGAIRTRFQWHCCAAVPLELW